MNDREIKFRAYVPELDVMLYNIAVYPDGQIGLSADDFEEAVKGKCKDWRIYDDEVRDCSLDADGEDKFDHLFTFLPGEDWVWLEEGEFELMQFVKLKDKNSKDAYSGDIFKDQHSIRTIFDVAGGFATESNPKSFGYGYQNNSNPFESLGDKQTASWFEGNCLIIGNIYQNPELINK